MTDFVQSNVRILTVAGLLGALALTVPGSAVARVVPGSAVAQTVPGSAVARVLPGRDGAHAVPRSADAQTVQEYTCADSSESGTTSASVSLTDPPASIAAGQSLPLQASLTLTLPQSFDFAATLGLISQVGISTTNFGVQLQIGKKIRVVPAAIVVGQLKTLTIGSPEEASAALTFPAVTIPRKARGDVVVRMPTAARSAKSATSTPAKVVFSAVLEQQSYLGSPSTVNLACVESATPAPTAQVIARIPIQAINATTKPTKRKTATSTKPKVATHAQSTGSASRSANGVPAAGTAPGSSAQGASTAGAQSTASAPSPSSSAGTITPAATATPANVTIPPRTVGFGTFIPTWELILMGSLLPIAAVWYATRTRRMLVAARTDLEHRRRSAQPHPVGSGAHEAEHASPSPAPIFVTPES